MKSPVAFPVVAGVIQMRIRRDLDDDTSGLLAAEASLTFPTASGARQEGVRRYVDGDARRHRELETTIAFPTATIGGVDRVRVIWNLYSQALTTRLAIAEITPTAVAE